MSEPVRAMGIGAKIASLHAPKKKGGQGKGQDKSPLFEESFEKNDLS